MAPALDTETTAQRAPLANHGRAALTSDVSADLIEKDPVAIRVLRQLILEGLESGDDGEADDGWLEFLKEGVRQRAACHK